MNLGILEKLEFLLRKGRIVVKHSKSSYTATYNHILRRLTLYSANLGFLRRDFHKQLTLLVQSEAPPERIRCVEADHARCLLALSGILIHEGQHALRFVWSRKADEVAAFSAEQIWYGHLYSLESEYKEAIASLATTAEYDARTFRGYQGLGLDVPSLIAREK